MTKKKAYNLIRVPKNKNKLLIINNINVNIVDNHTQLQ